MPGMALRWRLRPENRFFGVQFFFGVRFTRGMII